MVGVEAGGRSNKLGDHAATLCHGSPGVLHGALSYVLQDADGQTAPVHSVSAGLDYPGVGPEHSYWKDVGRVRYTSATDDEALDATVLLSRLEGIIPALESAHALAETIKIAPKMGKERIILVCLSGRGDKDCNEIAAILERREKKHGCDTEAQGNREEKTRATQRRRGTEKKRATQRRRGTEKKRATQRRRETESR
jgi:tryptophan synthase beta chain